MTHKALIIIDVQNDFCPGGALAVNEGDQIIPAINHMSQNFNTIIATQDWHVPGHSSFASAHAGKMPYETVTMPYGPQTLWPDHCVQGTQGAEFHPGLDLTRAQLIVRKGFHQQIDSYSAFFENDHKTPTGLTGYLREHGIDDLTFVGLATDFCVAYSAMDAVSQGFKASVNLGASRGIDLDGSIDAALQMMRKSGVELLIS